LRKSKIPKEIFKDYKRQRKKLSDMIADKGFNPLLIFGVQGEGMSHRTLLLAAYLTGGEMPSGLITVTKKDIEELKKTGKIPLFMLDDENKEK